jgi:hypothetical protein
VPSNSRGSLGPLLREDEVLLCEIARVVRGHNSKPSTSEAKSGDQGCRCSASHIYRCLSIEAMRLLRVVPGNPALTIAQSDIQSKFAAKFHHHLDDQDQMDPIESRRLVFPSVVLGLTIARLQHLLPTLQEWCYHHPCKVRFRLAGSPLPGGSRILWIAIRGFRSHAAGRPACRAAPSRRPAT